MSIDKLAPQAVEAEQSVLGSILIDADAILRVGDFLQARRLLPPAARGHLRGDARAPRPARADRPRDPRRRARRRDRLEEVGGPAYLASLMNAVPTAVHAEHYGRIVERKAVLRNLIGAAGKIAAVGYEEANDAEVAIDRAESILFEISQRRTDRRLRVALDAPRPGVRPARVPPRASRPDPRRADRARRSSTRCSAASSRRTSSSWPRAHRSGRLDGAEHRAARCGPRERRRSRSSASR